MWFRSESGGPFLSCGRLVLAAVALVAWFPAASAIAQEADPTVDPEPVEIELPAAPNVVVEEPVLPTPPTPPAPPTPPRIHKDAKVVFGDNVRINEDESVRDVVVFGGNLDIAGEVLGDAAVIGGSVELEGAVRGDLTAIGGGIRLGPLSKVGRSVVAVGGEIDRHPDAEVGREISEVPFGGNVDLRFGPWAKSGPHRHDAPDVYDVGIRPMDWIFGTVGDVVGLLVMVLVACVILLVARRPVERMSGRIREEFWKAGLAGLLAQILFLPVLIVLILVLAISIIGIPVLLLLVMLSPFVFLALFLFALTGYTASVTTLGKHLVDRFSWSLNGPYWFAALGIAAIGVWDVLGGVLGFGPGPLKVFGALFGAFSALLCYVALTVGFGSVLLTRFGTLDRWRRSTPDASPPIPPADPAADPPDHWEDLP